MRLASAVALALVPVVTACRGTLQLAPDDSGTVMSRQLLEAPDPALPGPYAVKYLTYGTGTDRQRAAYRDSVAFRTKSVDASKLVALGASAKSRKKYWGFGPDAFPVNGRVWYPDPASAARGAAPFPLILVVHGNHDMKKFSDPGYEYLGRLLASRGFITVSVDENFLNGNTRNENDARAWMLLEHLVAWRGFVADSTNPFYRRADLDRIILMGHSRGGEAVAHAAAFNHIARYPDDASLKFDFHFGIRGVVAIAPVDGQYEPADRLDPDVKNVDYLVFHGSHDGDVSTFMGLRQWRRVTFDDGRPHFKAAVYVYRANHGQWNTVWGNKDSGPRSGRILDLRPLLPPEQQRQFARVYIGAFAEAVLHDDRRYLPLFRDDRVAGAWLPKTMYITRFEESGFHALADYDNDVDPTTGSAPGVVIAGDSLASWKEAGLDLRWQRSSGEVATMQEWAAWLGWNRCLRPAAGQSWSVSACELGRDTLHLGPPAAYTLTLPDTLARTWKLDPAAALSFLLMPTDRLPGPRKQPGDTVKPKPGVKTPAPKPEKPLETKQLPPVDLTVELADAEGHTAALPLSRYGAVRRPLETTVLRRGDQERRRFANLYEYVLQSYTLPLADFRQATPSLDLSRLRTVCFLFDRAPAGTIILDEVGFTTGDDVYRVTLRR